MKFQISGKHIDIGDALQTHVKDAFESMMAKYDLRPTDAAVVFSRDGHEYVCESVLHLSTGLTAQARGAGTEIYVSFDQAIARMDKQLRRHKRRLKDHHKDRIDPIELIGAPSYILASTEESESEETADDTPVIVAEMETKVPTISVGEAVMQMELMEAPVQVFRNEKHGGVNVVYKREDGNIGWIDPRSNG